MADNPYNPATRSANKQYTHPVGILVSDHYRKPFGYSCYRPGGTRDWLIMYTLSGKGLIYNGGKEYLSSTERTITIISPGTPQDYYTAEGHIWDKLWAHFIPRITWADWLPVSNTNGLVYQLQIDSDRSHLAIESAFRRVLSYRENREELLRDELTMNALEEIILMVASHNQPLEKLDARIRKVLNILSEQFMEEHSTQQLANQVCLSPSRLSHLFKAQVGDSILETLIQYRLNHAEKMIKYTARPITEIALEAGFHSPDYFSRRFTSYFGASPSQYRKQQMDKVN